jgi:hypothetical protein
VVDRDAQTEPEERREQVLELGVEAVGVDRVATAEARGSR